MQTLTPDVHLDQNLGANCETKRVYDVILGGGGARGLSHLGAMKAIGESGIAVSSLIGVSMGALMASLCSYERNIDEATASALRFLTSPSYRRLQAKVMRASQGSAGRCETNRWSTRLVRGILTHQFLARVVRSPSLLPANFLDAVIDPLIPDVDIRDLPVPLHLVAVDLVTGRRVVLSSGSLRTAVRASMSIPGIFPAVPWEDQLLSDIGVYDAVPCGVVNELDHPSHDARSIIAVDVGRAMDRNVQCRSGLDAILRFQELAEQQIRQQSLQAADVVIRPEVQHLSWFDFTSPEPIIQAGYDAGTKSLQSRV
ncbi:patatin-like phospholipase family protein [Novipirellula sp.]|uniref:patatin-like phospholipase family protein n=1 Tax=Novipirellula sp. TaxID=2795430 RepID=UPI0035695775